MFIQGNEGDGCRCSDEGTLKKETRSLKQMPLKG